MFIILEIKNKLNYIDSIPEEIASRFPAMPGIDRDYLEEVLEKCQKPVEEITEDEYGEVRDILHSLEMYIEYIPEEHKEWW